MTFFILLEDLNKLLQENSDFLLLDFRLIPTYGQYLEFDYIINALDLSQVNIQSPELISSNLSSLFLVSNQNQKFDLVQSQISQLELGLS